MFLEQAAVRRRVLRFVALLSVLIVIGGTYIFLGALGMDIHFSQKLQNWFALTSFAALLTLLIGLLLRQRTAR